MFVIRSVTPDDLDELHELSQLITLINLPSDRAELARKIDISAKSFSNPSKDLEKNFYIFILLDTEQEKIIGASMIHGKHGTPQEPHFYLKVGREHKLSTSLNTGFIHGTLKFDMETNGYTEIGGLILDPSYRGHPDKLGKILSFARFLYIAENPDDFTKFIHSELLPPFDQDGNSPLWEAIGRKFLNMNYHDADKLSRENREFITSLYPIDTIYETLLPIEARDAIGKVGKSTEPVKRMLESIGFRYMEEVDPFDGGPHYRALKNDISLIKNHQHFKVIFKGEVPKGTLYLVSFATQDHSFYALKTMAFVDGDNIIVNNDLKKLVKESENASAFPL